VILSARGHERRETLEIRPGGFDVVALTVLE
jgi:hypothetical protein